MTYKASGTSLPPLKYKFPKRRNRDSKSKWLLILVIAIVCVVLAVTVIAVTIYLTSATDMTGRYRYKHFLLKGSYLEMVTSTLLDFLIIIYLGTTFCHI